MNPQQPIDVFISRKSDDAPLAKPLYDFLKAKGLRVFDSNYSLPALGNADYQRAIDHALETCVHMIVVGSSVENICSSWVDAEWRLYINEKRAGYKPGNILTVVSANMNIRSLPPTLRYYEVIVNEIQNFERIYAYVRQKDNTSAQLEEHEEKPAIKPIPTTKPKPPTAKEIDEWYEKGKAYYKSKDYENAVLYYSKAAELGNAVAQDELGYCYYNGYDVAQSYAEAIKWYRKAADQGNAIGQDWIGYFYQHGYGVSQDYTEVVKWYRKAVKQNLASAQNNLGNCYFSGQGVPKDYTEAVKYFRKAAEQGNYWGDLNLGYCYENGYGIEKNKETARFWYTKAAESGNEEAKKLR